MSAEPIMEPVMTQVDPIDLLSAIEEAMVADRIPGAAGFAARAVNAPYDRPEKEIPADPNLW